MARVQSVRICDVQTGMILAKDVLTENGRVLLSQGVRLTDQCISALRKRECPFVEVVYNERIDFHTKFRYKHNKVVRSKTAFEGFYQETVQIIKEAFESIRLSNHLPLDVIHRLVDSHIGPLMDTYGALEYIQNIRVHCDYTYRHSINVAIISGILGKAIELKKSQLEDLVIAGLLHDIGKISITLDILNKPGKLTQEEMELMKTHPENGYQFLLQYSQLAESVKRGVLHHHERNDGSGYPKGLTKNQISYYGKIVSIADIYDAMTTDRVYRKKLTPFSVAETLVEQMYHQLDPNLCLAFLNTIKSSVANSIVSLSNGQQGEVVYLHPTPTISPIIKLMDGTFLDLAKNKEIGILDIINDKI
ncbi:HD-GYP domain-containing protein [Pelosinus sp. sgz500959]|uniref:HD-GYP domain-containing protein n=1 Tax=Pelosinus sp. sgz500959 TaxID=3242472 RepID=UPI00366E10FC